MRLDLCSLAALALYLVLFSSNIAADARVKCPEKCNPQQKAKNLATLSNEACVKSTAFAYEVRLENTETTLNTDAYNMTILNTFKDDLEEPSGETRVFISRPTCKTKLNLKPGNKYLIMGNSAKEVSGTYYYMFDEQTWLEYWPTKDEGKTSAFKSQYTTLEEFRGDMIYGCKAR